MIKHFFSFILLPLRRWAEAVRNGQEAERHALASAKCRYCSADAPPGETSCDYHWAEGQI